MPPEDNPMDDVQITKDEWQAGEIERLKTALGQKQSEYKREQRRAEAAESACDKLQAFKDWTHNFLDSKGVPHHPPGTHGEHGCRIGDRMDWVWDSIERLTAELAEVKLRLLSAAGDDLCRLTQEEIKAYSSGAVKIPPKSEFIPSCERFHDQISGEAGVLENCLTLAQLIAENQRLKAEQDVDADQIIAMAGPHWVDEETKRIIREAKERAEAAESARDAALQRAEACFQTAETWERQHRERCVELQAAESKLALADGLAKAGGRLQEMLDKSSVSRRVGAVQYQQVKQEFFSALANYTHPAASVAKALSVHLEETCEKLSRTLQNANMTAAAEVEKVKGELASYKVENQHLVERIAEKVNDNATLREQLAAALRGNAALAEQLGAERKIAPQPPTSV